MTWRSFCDFVVMREMGHVDAIYRNYNFNRNEATSNANVHCAYKRMGFEGTRPWSWQMSVADIEAKLASYGLRVTTDTVHRYMQQWYYWDRIRTRELTRCKPNMQRNILLD